MSWARGLHTLFWWGDTGFTDYHVLIAKLLLTFRTSGHVLWRVGTRTFIGSPVGPRPNDVSRSDPDYRDEGFIILSRCGNNPSVTRTALDPPSLAPQLF